MSAAKTDSTQENTIKHDMTVGTSDVLTIYPSSSFTSFTLDDEYTLTLTISEANTITKTVDNGKLILDQENRSISIVLDDAIPVGAYKGCLESSSQVVGIWLHAIFILNIHPKNC